MVRVGEGGGVGDWSWLGVRLVEDEKVGGREWGQRTWDRGRRYMCSSRQVGQSYRLTNTCL